MAVRASNAEYLRSITSRLVEIPRDVAIDVGYTIFLEVISRTTIDSGQAALNWNMDAYSATPSFKAHRTLWGTNTRSPTGGAGYKNWFSHLGPTGDPSLIHAIMHTKATNTAIALRKKKFDGIVVYNPTNDPAYENNAFYIKSFSELADSATYKAYSRAKIKYPDLLG